MSQSYKRYLQSLNSEDLYEELRQQSEMYYREVERKDFVEADLRLQRVSYIVSLMSGGPKRRVLLGGRKRTSRRSRRRSYRRS